MPTATPSTRCSDALPPPTLERQSAEAQGAADLAQTALWRYRLRYLHNLAAYDEAIVAVSFNVAPPSDAPVAGDLPARADCRYRVRPVVGDDGEYVEALQLTCEQANGPAGRWPNADYRSPDGDVVDLRASPGDGATRTYALDPPLPAGYWIGIGLTWDGLNVAGAQNARASLTSVRRERDAGGADVERRSATIEATSVAVPFNQWPQRLDITDLGATVDIALDAALVILFGDERIEQRATIGVNYGYRLGPDPDHGPTASVPVVLSPDLVIDATTAMQIGTAMAAWQAATDPPAGGEWTFSLVLHSRFDAPAPGPLLDLPALVFRLRRAG